MILPNVSHCIAENEVHYNPFDPYNGHAYVDLGLPSGTKWATMNVGANSETDYGLHFAWGETQGYNIKKQDGKWVIDGDKQFSWDDYKFNPSHDGSTFTKYNATDGKNVLDAEDDAAAFNWGGQWHMPTKEQCQELFNTANCTNAWVTDYQGSGVNGRLFTSIADTTKTLFIPGAGVCFDGSVYNVGYYGNVWASSLNSSDVSHAWFFNFYNGGGGVDYSGYYRSSGFSVRGVVG